MNRFHSTTRSAHLRLTVLLLLITTLAAPATTMAVKPGYMKILEHAAEVSYLDLYLSSATSGSIRARRCDDCEALTLKVTADTVVTQGGARLGLYEAEKIRAQGATVFFDPQTMVVTRILMRRP